MWFENFGSRCLCPPHRPLRPVSTRALLSVRPTPGTASNNATAAISEGAVFGTAPPPETRDAHPHRSPIRVLVTDSDCVGESNARVHNPSSSKTIVTWKWSPTRSRPRDLRAAAIPPITSRCPHRRPRPFLLLSFHLPTPVRQKKHTTIWRPGLPS